MGWTTRPLIKAQFIKGLALLEKNSRRATQIVVSGLAVTLLSAHLLKPNLKVDIITLSLFVVIVVPWLTPLLKTLQLPGGFMIEFAEAVEKVREQADGAGLISDKLTKQMASKMTSEEKEDKDILERIVNEDPELALAGLRIKLEKNLIELARLNGIDPDKTRGVGGLLMHLNEKGVLSYSQTSVLKDLVNLLNSAVHGREINKGDAMWAMDIGLEIISSIEHLIIESNKSQGVDFGK